MNESLSSLSFSLSSNINLFVYVHVCGVSMLSESPLLEVDMGEQKWLSGETESDKGGKAVKNVLMSCLFCRQLGRISAETVEHMSGLLRFYSHLLPSTPFKKSSTKAFWLGWLYVSFQFSFLQFSFILYHLSMRAML